MVISHSGKVKGSATVLVPGVDIGASMYQERYDTVRRHHIVIEAGDNFSRLSLFIYDRALAEFNA